MQDAEGSRAKPFGCNETLPRDMDTVRFKPKTVDDEQRSEELRWNEPRGWKHA